MNYGIPNSTLNGPVAYASSATRLEFIRKVYGLFFLSLMVTVVVGAITASPGILPIAMSLMPVLCIGLIISGIALWFVRRTTTLNLAIFGLFATLQGAVFGPLLTFYERASPGLPMAAATITTAVFGGLSLYAYLSKKDFSYLGGMLFVGLIALIITGVVLMFFQVAFLSALYSLAGVLIFSGYVLYDTSQIVHHLEQDEAVVGAVQLYLDFINLFLFILRLLSSRD